MSENKVKIGDIQRLVGTYDQFELYAECSDDIEIFDSLSEAKKRAHEIIQKKETNHGTRQGKNKGM